MQHISVRIENNIATITFVRAEKFNSFIRSMALDFHKVLDEVAADESVRCIVITGSGKAFCAGQDLQEAVALCRAGAGSAGAGFLQGASTGLRRYVGHRHSRQG